MTETGELTPLQLALSKGERELLAGNREVAILIWSTALWRSGSDPSVSALRRTLTDRLIDAQLGAYYETTRLEYLGAALYTIEMRMHEVQVTTSGVSSEQRELETRRTRLRNILGEREEAAWSSFYRSELRTTLRTSDEYKSFWHGRNLAIASAPFIGAGAVLIGLGRSLGEVPEAFLWVGVGSLVTGAVLLPTGLVLRHRGLKKAENELARRHITPQGVRF